MPLPSGLLGGRKDRPSCLQGVGFGGGVSLLPSPRARCFFTLLGSVPSVQWQVGTQSRADRGGPTSPEGLQPQGPQLTVFTEAAAGLQLSGGWVSPLACSLARRIDRPCSIPVYCGMAFCYCARPHSKWGLRTWALR